MAAVYRGLHLDLKVDVAVKVLKRSGEAQYSPQAVARFRQEAEQAARLNDPNLVRIYDFPANRLGLLYLVMEYIDGETLESRIHRKGRLHPHEAVTITMLATKGLHTAHAEGVVHRDIKPPNILLSKNGRVEVTDLGIAEAQDSAAMGMTQEITLLGTPQYMSPELCAQRTVRLSGERRIRDGRDAGVHAHRPARARRGRSAGDHAPRPDRGLPRPGPGRPGHPPTGRAGPAVHGRAGRRPPGPGGGDRPAAGAARPARRGVPAGRPAGRGGRRPGRADPVPDRADLDTIRQRLEEGADDYGRAVRTFR